MSSMFEMCRLSNLKKYIGLIVLLLFGLFFLPSPTSASSPPSLITYQGKILENNASVTTTKAFTFLIFDTATAGTLLYTASGTLSVTTTINLTPTQGIFTIDLGGSGTNPLTSSTFANNSSLYLEVWINGQVLSPRKRLTAAPYALNSQFLMGYTASTSSTTTYIPVSDTNGNFSFTGTPQSTGVSGGILYINPTSAIANQTLFGIGLNASERFRIDASGNFWSTGTATINNALFVSTTATVLGNLFSGTTTEYITTSSFIMNGNDAYIADLLGVGNNLYVENNLFIGTSTLKLNGGITGGQITMSGGSLTLDASGRLNLNTLNNQTIITGSGFFGINTTTPTTQFSLDGDATLNGTSTLSRLTVTNSITFGGETRTTWPTGGAGGDSAWTTSTLNLIYPVNPTTTNVTIGKSTTSSPNNILEVQGNTYINGTLGLNSSTPSYTLSVSGTTYLSGTTTVNDMVTVSGRVVAPRHVGTLSNGTGGALLDGARAVTVSGNFAYVIADTNSGSGYSLNVIDIANIRHPRVLSVTTSANYLLTPVSVAAAGNFVYTLSQGVDVNTKGKLSIWDVSNPSSLQLVTSTVVGDASNLFTLSKLAIQGNYAYVVGNGGLKIVDISDPHQPRIAGAVFDGTTLAQPTAIAVSGNYAYVTTGFFSVLSVIDISDPGRPRIVGTLSSTIANAIYVHGTYLYTAGTAPARFKIIDVANPTTPTLLATLSNGDGGASLVSPYDVFVAGKYAYVTDRGSSGSGALEIIDITSSTNPLHVGLINHGDGGANLNQPMGISVQGNTVFVTANTGDALEILDISGASISNADIGTVKIGTLQVMNPALFDNSVSVRGGLSIGSSGLLISGDIGISSPTSSVTATNTIRFSHTAQFLTTASTSGNSNNAFIFNTQNAWASSSNKYLLSLRNADTPVFSVSTNGDVRASGTLYAFSATVGTPGSPGDLAERVDITPTDTVEPGDVITVDHNSPDTYKKTSSAYDTAITGVISTNPTIIVGNGKTDHTAILATIGRVPVKVSTENGPISRGDLLVSSHIPGVAMRYDPTTDTHTIVSIIGTALDTLDSTHSTGLIMTFIHIGWMRGDTHTLSVTETPTGAILSTITQDLDLNNHSLINVNSITGTDHQWEINASGRLITHLKTTAGPLDLYGVSTNQNILMFSGHDQLVNGVRRVEVGEDIREVVDMDESIHVQVTPTGIVNGIFVSEKTTSGFTVQETRGGISNTTFDWMIIAHRRQTTSEVSPTEDVLPVEAQTPIIVTSTVSTPSTTTANESVTTLDSTEVAITPVPLPDVSDSPFTDTNLPSTTTSGIDNTSSSESPSSSLPLDP